MATSAIEAGQTFKASRKTELVRAAKMYAACGFGAMALTVFVMRLAAWTTTFSAVGEAIFFSVVSFFLLRSGIRRFIAFARS